MIRSRKFVVAALVFPIFALMAVVANKASVRRSGTDLTLKISGFDPRDLLAGHYLIYTVDYGIAGLCMNGAEKKQAVYVCPRERVVQYDGVTPDCDPFIRGRCEGRRFVAGVERYYIPAEKAPQLDRLVRDQKGSVVLSVASDGTAQVKELLINGIRWDEFLRRNTANAPDDQR